MTYVEMIAELERAGHDMTQARAAATTKSAAAAPAPRKPTPCW